MSLGDYAGSGSQYLGEGWHAVMVVGVRDYQAHTGTDGVEFTVECISTQQTSKGSFSLNSKAALGRLCSFAQACGFTNEELARYDEKDPNSHRAFMNRKVKAFIAKSDKGYHEMKDWKTSDSDTPAVVPKQTPPASELPEPKEDDGIPF